MEKIKVSLVRPLSSCKGELLFFFFFKKPVLFLGVSPASYLVTRSRAPTRDAVLLP